MSPPRCDPRRHRRANVRFRREVSAVTQIGNGGSPPTVPTPAQLGRTAVVRDAYARWYGRGGAVRRPPIPIGWKCSIIVHY